MENPKTGPNQETNEATETAYTACEEFGHVYRYWFSDEVFPNCLECGEPERG